MGEVLSKALHSEASVSAPDPTNDDDAGMDIDLDTSTEQSGDADVYYTSPKKK